MSRFHFGNVQNHLETTFNEYDRDMNDQIGIDGLIKVCEELDEIPITITDVRLL